MSFPVIFSAANVNAMIENRRRTEINRKRDALRNFGCDTLLKSISNGFFANSATTKEEIFNQISEGKNIVLAWTGKQVHFNRHSFMPSADCRGELLPGDSGYTIEQEAFASEVHSAVFPGMDEDPNNVRRLGTPTLRELSDTMSIYAIIRYTDFLDVLAANFGPNFSCSWTFEDDLSVLHSPHWQAKIHRIFLRFWPHGVPQFVAARKKAAMEAFIKRQ
jgi:hypothetical protein